MAAVHTGAADSSMDDGIQGLASWLRLSGRHDVEHEEFHRMATDRCRRAGIVMILRLHSWIGYNHGGGVAHSKVVVMPIHQGGERLRRAVLLNTVCRRTCSSNALGEEGLANRLGCELVGV